MSFTITVSGQGGAFGVGSITEEQHEYWSEHEADLQDAFTQNLDQSDVPEDAQIEQYYDAFDDIGSEYGLDEESVMIKIVDDSNQVIFDGSYSDYVDLYSDTVTDDEMMDEHSELYVPFTDDQPGYFVFWSDKQSGIMIDCLITDTQFDPKKLAFSSCDLNGEIELITALSYDGDPLDIDLSGMSSDSIECTLHENA